MTDFERRLRYHALRGKTSELLQQKLLSLSEYSAYYKNIRKNTLAAFRRRERREHVKTKERH